MEAELDWVKTALAAKSVHRGKRLQVLWGGYGEIYRVHLEGARLPTAIVKSVQPPDVDQRESDVAHARKCRSYRVEEAFYTRYAARCSGRACRVPTLLAADRTGDRCRFLLEDLDAAGFVGRARHISADRLGPCLDWLAAFHASFLGVVPAGLWEHGTYWSLDTRAIELARIAEPRLREAAAELAALSRKSDFRTVVHGDSKVANFCFRQGADEVAAVDFQYAGGGVGVQDVAYLLLSASVAGDDIHDAQHLDRYFESLRRELGEASDAGAFDVEALERQWRACYPFACADYYRFFAGWAPARWDGDWVGHRCVEEVLDLL